MLMSFTHMVFDALCVTKFGYGRHEFDLPASIRTSGTPLMLFWLGQILFKLSILFTKLSLFFIYRDLFAQVDSTIIRITNAANYVTAFIVISYYGAATLVSIFSCTPVTKAWKPSQKGTCINSHAFLYSTAACNIITSLLLISIPIPLLLRTKHRKTESTQLLFLILLGLVDTASSIVRMTFINSSGAQAKNDTTWTLIPSTTAATIEMNVAIIAASLVVMRPCFAYLYGVISGHSQQNTYANSSTGYLGSDRTSKSNSNAITKTIDIRLTTRSVSQERILPDIVPESLSQRPPGWRVDDL